MIINREPRSLLLLFLPFRCFRSSKRAIFYVLEGLYWVITFHKIIDLNHYLPLGFLYFFFYVFVFKKRDLINMLSVTYRICYWRELIVTSQNRKVLIVSMTLHISNKTDTWIEHRFGWRYYIICFLAFWLIQLRDIRS